MCLTFTIRWQSLDTIGKRKYWFIDIFGFIESQPLRSTFADPFATSQIYYSQKTALNSSLFNVFLCLDPSLLKEYLQYSVTSWRVLIHWCLPSRSLFRCVSYQCHHITLTCNCFLRQSIDKYSSVGIFSDLQASSWLVIGFQKIWNEFHIDLHEADGDVELDIVYMSVNVLKYIVYRPWNNSTLRMNLLDKI